MGHILVVAEKPSVARDIAQALGAGARGEGRLSGGGYVVTWAIGHLAGLKEPEEIDEKYKRWRMEDLPMLPPDVGLKVLPKTRSQFAILKALMNDRETEKIICATDAGREGELIFRYIYQLAKCKKPFERLWISSMTKEAIREGFARLKPGHAYDALYESARCRALADWLIGMNASRAFTLRYGALLSVGRVQTPTLQILVSRRKEIDGFQAQPFWTVQANFGDYRGTWGDAERDFDKHILREELANEIAARVRGKPARVVSAEVERKSEPPPRLYDLTDLQRDANRLLGFSADRTLKVAQALYEKRKLITYPRTDSRYLTRDMAGTVQKALAALREPYAALVAPLAQKALPQPPRVFDDAKVTDHHAIVLTGKRVDPAALAPDEAELYDLIARRLIAAFYPPFVYDATRVITECEGERFLSSGRTVVREGFREVCRKPRAASRRAGEEEPTLPKLRAGDLRTTLSATVKKDQTKPPNEHTDASLLSEMERAGRLIEDEELKERMKGCSLGTPATRAAIIERLIAVGYVRRGGRQIIATEKGVRLVEVVPPEIASPETTGRWELALERIARGDGGGERFMEGIRRLTAFLTQYAASSAPESVFAPEERRGRKRRSAAQKRLKLPCPQCKRGEVVENEKAFGCSRWREGCGFTLWKNAVTRQGGPELTAELARALLTAEHGDLRGSTGTLHFRDGKVTFTAKR